jgi:hypothetical protein
MLKKGENFKTSKRTQSESKVSIAVIASVQTIVCLLIKNVPVLKDRVLDFFSLKKGFI